MTTIPDTHTDLLAGVPGALATLGPDGYPQVTAVMAALMDDGRIHASVHTGRQKYRNLVRHPKATLFVIDPAQPMRTIEVRGDVELVPDPGKAWSKAFLQGAVDLDVMDPPDVERVHLILSPTKVNTISPDAMG